MMQIMQRSHRSLCHHCLLFLRHGNVFKRAERSGTACHKFFQNEPHRMQRFSTSSSPTSTRNDDLEYVDDDKFHDMSTEDQLDYIEKMEVQARMEELQANPRPWANLLGYPSRARWRVTKDYPKQLIGERASILNETHRTSRQFKRAIRVMVEQQQKLAKKREVERRRNAIGDKRSRRRRKIDSKVLEESIAYGPEQTLSFLYHRMLPNFATTERVLLEIKSLLGPSFRPKSVVDFGCGCGSASAAAMNTFADHETRSTSLEWIHGIDPSTSQREAAQRLLNTMKIDGDSFDDDKLQALRQSARSQLPRITTAESLALKSSKGRENMGTFDLALFCYTAQDMTSNASILAAAAILWEKLNDGGVLVVIEPGTPDGFNSIRSIREMLLECCPISDSVYDEKCHVIAPCTHNGKCPMDRFIKHRKIKPEIWTASDGDVSREADNAESNSYSNEELDLLSDDNEAYDDFDDDEADTFSHPDEKEWFEKEFETLIIQGKLSEKDGLIWRPEEIVSSSRRVDAHTEKTTAFESGFCGFPQMIPGGSRTGEKFSYVALQKRVKKTQLSSYEAFKEDDIVQLLKHSFKAGNREALLKEADEIEDRFIESKADQLGLELLQGEKRLDWGRLIRAPLKRKGHIILDFCCSEGKDGSKIVRHRVSKAKAENSAPGMFSAARKSRWGGFWPNLSRSDFKE